MSLPPKDPAEKVVITFDFTDILTPISSPVVSIFEKGTATDLYSTMGVGVFQLTGNTVLQLIQGGTSGKQYDIRCQVDILSTGERFVVKDTLSVKNL